MYENFFANKTFKIKKKGIHQNKFLVDRQNINVLEKSVEYKTFFRIENYYNLISTWGKVLKRSTKFQFLVVNLS